MKLVSLAFGLGIALLIRLLIMALCHEYYIWRVRHEQSPAREPSDAKAPLTVRGFTWAHILMIFLLNLTHTASG